MSRSIISKKNIYYLTTFFIAVLVGFVGGTVDIFQTQAVIEAAAHLGYPLYFFFLLGVFKILGGFALILPAKFNKAKEIAYIGFAFDFIFASFSHYSVGDGTAKVVLPLILLAILAVSYFLKDRLN